MRLWAFFALLLSISVSNGDALAADLDSRVSAFLNSRDDAPMAVYLLYQSGKPASQALSPSAFEADLRRETQLAESAVLSKARVLKKASTYWIAQSSLIEVTRAELQRILQSDRVVSVTAAHRAAHLTGAYAPGLVATGLPKLNQTNPNLDGTGVRVAIIDTGVDPMHPDLSGKVLGFHDFIDPSSSVAFDDHGHGTHVAGTIAGGNHSGTAIGMAPGAGLLIAKAFSQYGGTEDALLLSALQWIADPDGDPKTADGAQVLSASWNVDGDLNRSPSDEPFCVAVRNLAKLGTVPVFAAGNDGPGANTVKMPGACPEAVTVAATDDTDNLADFSSRGPVRWKTMELVKPEITAPGVDVYSTLPGGEYGYKSGTSMATPHVAGALAILRQAFPSLTVSELIARMYGSAHALGNPLPNPNTGFGRVDIFKAANQYLPSRKGQ